MPSSFSCSLSLHSCCNGMTDRETAVLCCNSFWSTCSSVLRWTLQRRRRQQQQRSSAELSWTPTVRIQSERGNKSGLAEENLILTDVDKDEPPCAFATGRDNIPKLKGGGKGLSGQTDRDTCVPKTSAMKDLAGLASLGQLGYRHWECYGMREGHVGVGEAAQKEFHGLKCQEKPELIGWHELLVQCHLKRKNTAGTLWRCEVLRNSSRWFSAEVEGYLCDNLKKRFNSQLCPTSILCTDSLSRCWASLDA